MKQEIVNVIVMEMFNVVECHSYTKANVKKAEEKFKSIIKEKESKKYTKEDYEAMVDEGYYACSNDLTAVALVWSDNQV